MRLIDVDEIKLPQGFFEKVDNVPKFYKWLDEQPTVDAEPVRPGHWITQFDDLFPMESTIECSICGEKEWMMTINNHNYCPHCGAKMDDGEDDFVDPDIYPCRICDDYDRKRGCMSKGGCGERKRR